MTFVDKLRARPWQGKLLAGAAEVVHVRGCPSRASATAAAAWAKASATHSPLYGLLVTVDPLALFDFYFVTYKITFITVEVLHLFKEI